MVSSSSVDLERNFENLTQSQRVMVLAWHKVRAEPGDWCYKDGEDTRYMPEDYVAAARCGVAVEKVGDALVAAGLRPPLWWIG